VYENTLNINMMYNIT